MSNIYYQDELQYLREVGPEFARANPEIARFLADRGSDPDVERVVEGVAFLCGRIREKLDDELPELTATMMALLWPHYLRTIPSVTILELLPEIEAMQGPLIVEAGSEFASVPVDGTRCRYRSCDPVALRPWAVRDVRLETAAANPVRLIITLAGSSKAPLDGLELDSVNFHLAGEPRAAFSLYLLLAAHVDHVTVSDGSERHDRPEFTLPASSVTPAGLAKGEGILPYPVRSFVGYRLIQEYFAFRERFLFVDVTGLDRAVEQLELTETIEVAITFNRRLDSPPAVSRGNVRLHCLPVINLFAHAAEPVRLTHERTEYLLQPTKSGIADGRHAEVYSVDQVSGLTRADAVESREFSSFYSFDHMSGEDRRTATYYQTHLRPNVLGGDPRLGTDTYISFVVGGSTHDLPPEETISIELTCTNRDLPSELRAGDVIEPTDSSPPNARFRNISKPTVPIPPPMGRDVHWRLISHMALNYVSLTDAKHFKELLRVYDFQADYDAQEALAHQRMLEGIVSLGSRFGERMVRGAPLRGSRIDLELNEDHFAGEGDAYLFATVLDRFMALYATLNAFTQLNVRFVRSGQSYSFAPRIGEQITPADSLGTEGGHG